MKIYTRTGDRGETGLRGGGRFAKNAQRLEVCGTIDELNSVLGLVRTEPLSKPLDELLTGIQNGLFQFGAEIATPDTAANDTAANDTAANDTAAVITPRHVKALEESIDRLDATLEPLAEFILPGGTRTAAQLHLARAVCRRAERRLVTLAQQTDEKTSPTLLAYLNRLGDLLFVLARAANAEAGRPDVGRQ